MLQQKYSCFQLTQVKLYNVSKTDVMVLLFYDNEQTLQ